MDVRFGKNNFSLFNYIRDSKKLPFEDISSKKISYEIQKNNSDFKNIIEKITLIQNSVIKSRQDISLYISELEFLLATGNNDKNITKSFYSSKVFLDIIDILNISLPEYHEKLLTFIEKILSDKLVSKYLSKSEKLLPRILKFLTNPKTSESAIKISEILLINGLVSIDKMYSVISTVYNYMSKNKKLDLFCRVLGILIFDCRKIEIKQIFKSKETLKIKSFTKMTTENQSICIHMDKFLENIVDKLKERFEDIRNYAKDKNIDFFYQESKDIYIENFESKLTYDGNIINKNELLSILQLNIFETFTPKYNSIPKNENNIFNTYTKMTHELSLMINKNKIRQSKKQYITYYKYKSYQIEMLFVLSTLLASKRKVEIQDKLGKLNIIKLLASYLEYIEWGNIFSDNHRPFFNDQINVNDDTAYHGEGCCCDCDTALKIQYLRLIYTFCCRDNNNFYNKLKLFSKNDIFRFLKFGYMDLIKVSFKEKYDFYKNKNKNNKVTFNNILTSLSKKLEINKIKEKEINIEKILLNLSDPKSMNKIVDYYNKNDNEIGLLQKLIFKYIQECYYSSAKFWLSSCIEVVLRGNNTFFQTYIASSGLLPCLLYDILYSKQDQNQILQLSFDILGELIKFNRSIFYLLDYYFCDKVEFKTFCNKIISNDSLVDSNVFLRAIILSNYLFDKTDKENKVDEKNYFTNKCKICSFIKSKLENIFISLISIVKINDINQTNISCINSGLLIFIIEYMKNNLANFLTQLRKKYYKEVIPAFDNFKNLLKMWKDFYNYRPKDSASLQNSTTIPFNIWQKVTDLLLKNDENEVCSLFYK